ncbi:hypothetical protein B0O80DRAFT_506149 [Mortierella sp. GBAus27b]|nr:hypothetical protein B0O80DRAFT_506139 [Mortierella sp. GBAus27b]KAI8356309.1 hypothetical protein B0O80DRAFT_506149 [Mortierella sp. GBAus27b]
MPRHTLLVFAIVEHRAFAGVSTFHSRNSALQPYLSVPVGNSLASLLRYGLSRDVVYIHNPPNVFVAAKEPSMGLLLGGGLDLRVPKEDDDLGIPSAEESEQDTTAVLDEPPVIKIQEHADPETADASDSEAPPTLVPFTPVKSTSVLTKPVDPPQAKQMGVITDEPLPQVTTVPAAAPAPKPQVCKFKTLDLKTIPQWDPTWNGTKSDVRAFLGTMRDARRRLTASSSRPITIESIRDIWLHAVKTLGGDGVELAEGFRIVGTQQSAIECSSDESFDGGDLVRRMGSQPPRPSPRSILQRRKLTWTSPGRSEEVDRLFYRCIGLRHSEQESFEVASGRLPKRHLELVDQDDHEVRYFKRLC